MTLTELSIYVRKLGPFVILGAIILMILYFGIQLAFALADLNTQQQEVPEETLAIDPIFDSIPRPILSEATSSARFEYRFDTLAGVPESLGEKANVYFLPEKTVTFGFRENVFLMAKSLGFNTEEAEFELDENKDTATFVDETQRLSVNIRNFNFDYEYSQLAQERQKLAQAEIPNEDRIRTVATDVLQSVDRYPAELARGKTNIIYLAFNPETEQMTVVETPEAANLVEVDFFRQDPEEGSIVSPRFFNSQNYVILLFNDNEYQVVRAKMQFFPKSEQQVGVYPLKTGDQAFETLQAGGGYVVSGEEITAEIGIENVYLGYLDPSIYQPYLQPVYVYLGGNNFVAYVPAVADEWLTEASAPAIITLTPKPTARPTEEPDESAESDDATGAAQPSQPGRQSEDPRATIEAQPATSSAEQGSERSQSESDTQDRQQEEQPDPRRPQTPPGVNSDQPAEDQ